MNALQLLGALTLTIGAYFLGEIRATRRLSKATYRDIVAAVTQVRPLPPKVPEDVQ
jgi:hypothetical protein